MIPPLWPQAAAKGDTMKNVAVIGSGVVGEALAAGFLKHGYRVMRASRDPGKLKAWKDAGGRDASTGTFAEAAAWGDAVVLAVKGTAAEAAVDLCGAKALSGKIVMDATNPIADAAPENGVLRYFTDINRSLMEQLQERAPKARFVKVFSCVGNAFMVNPDFGGEKPTMFICGNDAVARRSVAGVLAKFGWDVEDLGTAEAARAIEPLAMLWCIPGLRENRWSHALRLLRK
jgi:8-hydroxy-5-deazaflavin:NADPH oxidoreductase